MISGSLPIYPGGTLGEGYQLDVDLQRYALVATGASNARARLGRGTEILRGDSTAQDASLVAGSSLAAVCGLSGDLRQGLNLEGDMVALDQAALLSDVERAQEHGWFSSSTPPSVRGEDSPSTSPLIGLPQSCSVSLTPCASDVNCPMGETCEPKNLDCLTNPFVDCSCTSPRCVECQAARTATSPLAAAIEGLTATDTPGTLKIKGTPAPLSVGNGLQVLDVISIRLAKGATFEINGTGDPDAILVVRVDGGFTVGREANIVLSGGLLPEHVCFYFRNPGAVKIGRDATMQGSILALTRKFKLGIAAHLEGAVFAESVQTKTSSKVTHKPFTGCLN